ncbi:senescence-associated protein SPA15, chloroplastic isoform X2 [Malania oleifera]|uniref:senescence-associated protein SPA15, chloroplastic isoform X2 n=1 Tax=Malania oleifera TaxID=397392 RepID=UPI0025AE2617|nr:senescence-associated protein SPA15, chloroplastic isoform X2 [Malania oleifera]
MAVTASKFSSGPAVTKKPTVSKSCGIIYSFSKLTQNTRLYPTIRLFEHGQHSNGHPLTTKLSFSDVCLWHTHGGLNSNITSRRSCILCQLTRMHNSEAKECARNHGDYSDLSSAPSGDDDKHPVILQRSIHSSRGLAEACKFVYNDAKFVNERARNDIIMLSRGIMRLDARARQDFAILGLEFLKLDARAREDTERIDHDVKEKAEHLHHIASILKNKAQSRLKSVADRHWSDGALEADLRRADFCAKRRAMEDALMALEFIKDINDLMVSKLYKLKKGSLSANNTTGHIMLEKNGKTLDFFPGEVSTNRITAIQEAYLSMASALSEADGIDYTDPEELELLVAALIDLDAMDGKSSVSLLAECSSSPDVNMRRALANALAAAPSMWALGNAGMGALQRLAEDSNPTIAAAASKAIRELKKQWEIEEGDSWRFMMDQKPMEDVDSEEDNNNAELN